MLLDVSYILLFSSFSHSFSSHNRPASSPWWQTLPLTHFTYQFSQSKCGPRKFPGCPVVKTLSVHCRCCGFDLLVRELRSHKPYSAARKKKKRIRTWRCSNLIKKKSGIREWSIAFVLFTIILEDLTFFFVLLSLIFFLFSSFGEWQFLSTCFSLQWLLLLLRTGLYSTQLSSCGTQA